MTHSFVVTSGGAAKPDAGAMAAIFDAFAALMAMVGGAGAILAGEPALDGVDTAGDAMSLIESFFNRRQRDQRHTLDMSLETPSTAGGREQSSSLAESAQWEVVEERGEVAEIDLGLSDREIMQAGALTLRRLPSSDGLGWPCSSSAPNHTSKHIPLSI